GNYNVF
nr:Chain A, Heterogeneous nuclear ribonucleoprotein A2 [Homo sapiens]